MAYAQGKQVLGGQSPDGPIVKVEITQRAIREGGVVIHPVANGHGRDAQGGQGGQQIGVGRADDRAVGVVSLQAFQGRPGMRLEVHQPTAFLLQGELRNPGQHLLGSRCRYINQTGNNGCGSWHAGDPWAGLSGHSRRGVSDEFGCQKNSVNTC